MATNSSFGQLLRMWRKQRELSQIKLAELAFTTSRYISFLETGRARPGIGMVTRLADALGLSNNESDTLYAAAGHISKPVSNTKDSREGGLFLKSVSRLMSQHDPYPACAVDTQSRIVLANDSFERFFPGFKGRTAEESIDDFFGPGPLRDKLENWLEIAWVFIDRRIHEAARTNDPRLIELSQRALAHMEGFPRPLESFDDGPFIMKPRFRIGDGLLRTYVTVARFEGLEDFKTGDLRIEFMFPEDDASDAYFRQSVI